MAEVNPPLFIEQSNAYNAWDIGLPMRDLVGEGVVGINDLVVSQRGAGANNSVDVAAGSAWVLGDDNATLQPCYRVYNNGARNITIAQDATFHRWALIVAHVYDAHFSGATYTWALEVVLGTPSGSPVVPALPNNCLLLAQVDVPQTGTAITNANITDKRVRAQTGGGQLADGATKLWDSVESAVVLPSASITTPTLNQGFKHLMVVSDFRTDRAAQPLDTINVRLNGISSATYNFQFISGANAAVGAQATALATAAAYSVCQGAAATALFWGASVGFFPHYSDSSVLKNFVSLAGGFSSSVVAGGFAYLLSGMNSASATAISTLTFLSSAGANIISPSRITVYGLG
jgi:hypothetical protein